MWRGGVGIYMSLYSRGSQSLMVLSSTPEGGGE